jgi:hypothetical protein
MSIEIKIPKEINDYKEKFFFGMTRRQLIAAAIIGGTCAPILIFGHNFVPTDVVQTAVIIIAAPTFFLGFFPNYQGMRTEEFISELFNFIVHTQKREYEELPVFWHAREEIISDILIKEKNDFFKKGNRNVKNKK